jgi:hypothetical protein
VTPIVKPEPQDPNVLLSSATFNRDNLTASNRVKAEPADASRAVCPSFPLFSPDYVESFLDSQSSQEACHTRQVRELFIFCSSTELSQGEAGNVAVVAPAAVSLFRTFATAADIEYSPELSLKEGMGMVTTLRNHVNNMKLGSKLRQEVWLRELKRFVDPVSTSNVIAHILFSVWKVRLLLRPL